MIGVDKIEKLKHLKFFLPHLWQGKTAVVLEFLRERVVVKNQDKWQELVGYARETSTGDYQLQSP